MNKKYKILCSTQSYSTLLKFGGISLEDFQKTLSEKDIKDIKTVSKWNFLSSNIIHIINSNEIKLEDSDLSALRLDKKISNGDIGDINTIFKSEHRALYSVNKILRGDLVLTDNDEKETRLEEKTFSEKYPMLKLIKDNAVSSENFSILNEYINLMINKKNG